MGWHPTSPEYASFPNPPRASEGNIVRGRRGSTIGGVSNSATPGRRWYGQFMKHLVASARERGWFNGIPIKKARDMR